MSHMKDGNLLYFKEPLTLKLIIWKQSKFSMAFPFIKNEDELPYFCNEGPNVTSWKGAVWWKSFVCVAYGTSKWRCPVGLY